MTSFIENKKARFNYEITETFEAGIELLGPEVKSIKGGQGSLEGAYAVVRGGEVFLLGSNIPPYQAQNMPGGYDPLRTRKLLLTKKEILELSHMEKEKKLTMVPLSMYNKKGKIKVSLGIARGKKKFDKRETLKKRDDMREISRTLKNSL
ncbi:MAG: SsrA-binding protein SmpB [Candidatus Paceibacterota bacterium]